MSSPLPSQPEEEYGNGPDEITGLSEEDEMEKRDEIELDII